MAYTSRIMSKNFRKEGQPEKERIALVTGMELEKVSDEIWQFTKKFVSERALGTPLPEF